MATVCAAAQSILDQATALWPNRSRISDGTIGDPAHAARTSDHNPDARGIVHAADLTHDPANGCDAHYWADQARLRAQRGDEPRLKYVISNRRIASPTDGWAWRTYTGSNPHDHHAHFSVNSGPVENDDSPWFVGAEEEEDITIMDDATKAYLDAKFKAARERAERTNVRLRVALGKLNVTQAQLEEIDAEVDEILARGDD